MTARIERTDPAELIHLNQAQDQVDFILLARERLDGTPDAGGSRMIHWQHIVANDQAQRFDPAYAKLQEVFRARFRDLQHRQDIASTAADATNVLWHIHRFQAHRHELGAKYAAVADALDARVCAILNASS